MYLYREGRSIYTHTVVITEPHVALRCQTSEQAERKVVRKWFYSFLFYSNKNNFLFILKWSADVLYRRFNILQDQELHLVSLIHFSSGPADYFILFPCLIFSHCSRWGRAACSLFQCSQAFNLLEEIKTKCIKLRNIPWNICLLRYSYRSWWADYCLHVSL